MPVKGIEQVKKKLQLRLEDISGQMTERAVYQILQTGAGYAATMTPVDTSNLINSQYAPQINQETGKVTGTVGYSAEYAKYVHDASGKLKGTPRSNGNGDYWDPDGEPQFLKKGFDMAMAEIPAILKATYE